MSNKTHLAFIGFGEVGQLFSRQLLAHDHVAIAIWDLKLADPETVPAMIARAKEIGVRIATSAADAAKGTTLVISAVTASAAEDVAREAAGYLVPGQVLFDLNSASPTTKTRAAAALTARGLSYVEGAVMAPVAAPGITVQILTGGPEAAAISETLNALGMNLRPVSDTVGRASATKLCRSIMIKGLEALIIDCDRAAKHWGVKDDVFASLAVTFPSINWPELAEVMAGRVRQHGVRRAAEMRECGAMLDEIPLDGGLARAIADSHERFATTKI